MKEDSMLENLINKKVYTKKEKSQYASLCMDAFAQLGYKGEIDTSRIGMKKIRNIMIGNFKTAKHIIVVPYDAPRKVFWPNYTMYPQDGALSIKKNFIPNYTPMIICYLFLLAIVYLFPSYLSVNGKSFVSIIALVYLAFLAILVFRGFANKHNAVGRDGAIQVAYEVAKTLPNSKRREIAFVFTDANTFKMQGSEALEIYLQNIHRKPNKIVLYCLGQGDVLALGYRKGCRKVTQDLMKKYKGKCHVVSKVLETSDTVQLPMDYLNEAIMISNGTLLDNHVAIKKACTGKDKENDQDLLKEVKDMLIAYLQ